MQKETLGTVRQSPCRKQWAVGQNRECMNQTASFGPDLVFQEVEILESCAWSSGMASLSQGKLFCDLRRNGGGRSALHTFSFCQKVDWNADRVKDAPIQGEEEEEQSKELKQDFESGTS